MMETVTVSEILEIHPPWYGCLPEKISFQTFNFLSKEAHQLIRCFGQGVSQGDITHL
jgi:hypothetical protein